MLSELRLSGLGVIEAATVELSPGLNVLTGETGAGKTMVVTALGLLRGQRADAGLVRHGADHLLVEGWWAGPLPASLLERLEELGLQVDSDEDLSTSRQVSAAGRSRGWVAGRGVPAATLATVADTLVAVHGQADQWRLARPSAQREVLDRFGGEPVAGLRSEVDELVTRWRSLRADVAALAAADRDALQRAETLRHGLAAIEEVDPKPGEDEELRATEERLGHADELVAAADALHTALAGEHLDGVAEETSAVGLLTTARAAMTAATEHDAALTEFEGRARELAYLATDLASDVAAYAGGIEADPAALAAVQERRAAIGALLRRYGDTVADVLAWSKQAAEELYLIDTADERREAAEAELVALEGELAGALSRLSAARTEAAERLGAAATAELKHLAMGKARVSVEVRPLPPEGDTLEVDGQAVAVHRHGCDEVELVLAANPGAPGRPLAKAASGGELSRVMLALELVTGTDVSTYVFDEVDAGVGGVAAVEVGARLARLAEQTQVIVVTHLPQVAAYADRHLVVRKAGDGDVTVSGVTHVEGAEREAELARMLSGAETDTALEHARELLARSQRR